MARADAGPASTPAAEDASLVVFSSPDGRLSLRGHAPLGLEQWRLLCYALAAALPGGEAELRKARLAELFPGLTLSLALAEALLRLRLLYEPAARTRDGLLLRLFASAELRGDGALLHLRLDERARELLGSGGPRGAYVAAPLPRPREADAGAVSPALLSGWRGAMSSLTPGMVPRERRAPLELYGLLARAFYGDAARSGGAYAPHTAVLPAAALRELAPAEERHKRLRDLLSTFMTDFPCRLRVGGQELEAWARERAAPEDELAVEVTSLGFDAYEGSTGKGETS